MKNILLSLLIILVNSCSKKKDCSKVKAISIAEEEWVKQFGDEIKDLKPFTAKMKNDSIWVIEGSLPEGFDGGVPYAEINANSCVIISISHSK